MAIDTAAKRRSALTVVAGIAVVSITPDATKPIAWRQDAGWGYRGIETGTTTVPTYTMPAPTLVYRKRPDPLRYRSNAPAVVYRPKTPDPLEVV